MSRQGWITQGQYHHNRAARPRVAHDRRQRFAAEGLLLASVLGALTAWLLSTGGAA
jgi:hypothetical protein